MKPLRVLIVGGYGTFGSRIASMLSREPGVVPVVSGRSAEKARAKADEIGGSCEHAVFDRRNPSALVELSPDIVIDASGPFQYLGSPDYSLPEACITHGIDYVDLSDGRDFVRGITSFDACARNRGVFVISGASTYPALSTAAVASVLPSFKRLVSIRAGIAPSPHVEMGLNVIRAVCSYGGKPVVGGNGLIDGHDHMIGVPGGVPMRRRRFLLVEAPDMKIDHEDGDGVSVCMGAGTEPGYLQGCLSLFARLVHVGALRSMSGIATFAYRVRKLFRSGEHRGGMFVEVVGSGNDDRDLSVAWNLVAEGDDGPYIPASAAVAIVRKCREGARPDPGARSAAGELVLSDFDAVFASNRLSIRHGLRWVTKSGDPALLPLYRRLLGSSLDTLPASIVAMHDVASGSKTVSGISSVRRGRGILARIVASFFGFPPEGDDIPVSVEFTAGSGIETWIRDFDGRRFKSVQSADHNCGVMVESFGPFRIRIAPVIDEGQLRLVTRGWSLWRIPLPLALAPSGDTYESEKDGVFRFHVEIGSPLTGLIVGYQGWLKPA